MFQKKKIKELVGVTKRFTASVRTDKILLKWDAKA